MLKWKLHNLSRQSLTNWMTLLISPYIAQNIVRKMSFKPSIKFSSNQISEQQKCYLLLIYMSRPFPEYFSIFLKTLFLWQRSVFHCALQLEDHGLLFGQDFRIKDHGLVIEWSLIPQFPVTLYADHNHPILFVVCTPVHTTQK